MVEKNALVRIKFNNKFFDVFVDGKHNKRFLEVINKGDNEYYCHPLFSDLINLDLIYNYKKMEKYTRKDLEELKKMKKKYSDLKKASNCLNLFTKTSMIFFLVMALANSLDIDGVIEKSNYIGASNFEEVEENDSDLFVELRRNLNKNKKIDDSYKEYFEEYIELLEEKLPDANIKYLNLNIKNIKLVLHDSDSIDEFGAVGSYNAKTNTIHLSTKHPKKVLKNILFHEITHALTTYDNTYSLNFNTWNKNVKKNFEDNSYGSSIDEGVTEVITNYLLSDCSTMEEYFSIDKRNFVGYNKALAPVCYRLLILTKDEYSLYDYIDGNIYDYADILDKYSLAGMIDYLDFIKNNKDEIEVVMVSDEFSSYLNRLNKMIKLKNDGLLDKYIEKENAKEKSKVYAIK